ncbi:receptor expression-enhancing protein 5-like protein [Blastocystis sp. ATCC 50177/Nand II]|uniref:Receptor expression-enhancing protein 5-like protein n=1 Tax=Blastocystis sp. subtype 1 (strain ATCC 50177 / NandII) TaxID=478820 RepID=A0A196SCY8_BLAHN|nr:receptor expression-enhancing protein 5-like protein [Blastocystis sp. ATCC 50177/Nand II]
MEHYKELFSDSMNQLDELLKNVPYMEMLSNKAGIRKCYIAVILLFYIVVCILLILGVRVFLNLIAFIYPAYASLDCIITKNTEEHVKWMTYWILFAVTAVLECSVIGTTIPFFSFSRCVFLVACYLPQINLAKTIYDQLLCKFIPQDKKED